MLYFVYIKNLYRYDKNGQSTFEMRNANRVCSLKSNLSLFDSIIQIKLLKQLFEIETETEKLKMKTNKHKLKQK